MSKARDPIEAHADKLAHALREHPDTLLFFYLANAKLADIERIGGPDFAAASRNVKHATLMSLLSRIAPPLPAPTEKGQ